MIQMLEEELHLLGLQIDPFGHVLDMLRTILYVVRYLITWVWGGYVLPFLGLEIDPMVQMGDLLSTASILISIAVGVYSLYRFRKTMEQGNRSAESAHYSELDRFYADLLKTAIAYPFLRSPKAMCDDCEALESCYEAQLTEEVERHQQYDAYAFMLWNFLETIHDRVQEARNSGDIEGYVSLRRTWQPVISAENSVHRGWFLTEMRREELLRREMGMLGKQYVEGHKFCKGFRIFVYEYQWLDKDKDKGSEGSWEYRKEFTKPLIIR